MRQRLMTIAEFACLAAFIATPALAGIAAPEPEVAGGLLALGALGLGFRLLRNRIRG